MAERRPPANLNKMLDRLDEVSTDKERVSVGAMLEATGRRSFGVLLLVPGLIVLSPLSGIPGLPTSIAILVLLVALQLLIGRDYFWLPQWLLKRSASRDRMQKALRFLRPIAHFVDRLIRPRLSLLTEHRAVHLIAGLCVIIALTMPPLEILPFVNSMAGAVLTTLGLGLVAHDGVLVIIALLFLAAMAFVVVPALLL